MTTPSLKRWFGENSRAWIEFKAVMDSPVMQDAMSILTELGTPVNSVPPDGVPFIEWNAMLNASREGYAQCLRNLRNLAEPPVAMTQPTQILQPWQHYAATTETPAVAEKKPRKPKI